MLEEVNREAVLAIQGGGVFGLSLLGQAKAVIAAGYVPLAYAGTSAGAILATLLWAGLGPAAIEQEFVGMVERDAQALLSLLSPFEPPPKPHFDFSGFLDLRRRVNTVLESAGRIGEARWFGARWRQIATAAGRMHGLWRAIEPHVSRRGLFSGGELEATVERLLRRGLGHQPGFPPEGELLRFSHVAEATRLTRGRFSRPPLLLTATNISRRRLELISSIDPRYGNVPIATAVRASAGFPVFFRPQPLQECPDGGVFVDGGVIANFPIWTFSDAFRQKAFELPEWRLMAIRPWIRIGLRVVADEVAVSRAAVDKPGPFLGSLLGLLTGGVRNELEELLARQAPRSITIRQTDSQTGGPASVLDVAAIDASRIREMVRKGEAVALAELQRLGTPAIIHSDAADPLRLRLRELMTQCHILLGPLADAARLRANVFLPIGSRLRMVASINMDGDPDDGIEFPSFVGLTGACYRQRSRLVCNLQQVAALEQSNPGLYERLFGLPPELQRRVRKDRTWLASMPIFDPYELRVLAGSAQAIGLPGVASADAGIDLTGPVLGTLNVDAAWRYEAMRLPPEPAAHVASPLIQGILALMQSTSISLARILVVSIDGG